MRISTQTFYQRNTQSMFDSMTKTSQLNTHIAASKRVIYASDDPVAISTIHRLNQDIFMGDQFKRNGEMANTANSLEETALEQTTTLLQRTRELMVTAGNETYNLKNREALAIELENLREELIGIANTKDSNSQFIFAGFQVDTTPFQTNEFGEIDYHGDDGSQEFQIGTRVKIKGNDPGSQVFMNIPEGNGTFVAGANDNNTGGGVINTSSIINDREADKFKGEDYTIAISEAAPGADPDYSAYGLKQTSVTGNAKITINSINIGAANFGNVDPALFDPGVPGGSEIKFVATANPNEFVVSIDNGTGVVPLPSQTVAFDSGTTSVNIEGIKIDVKGIPNDQDTLTVNKYIEPTKYEEDQSIEFNGIKTKIKGELEAQDSFSLKRSENKDIFSTMSDCIDALRMPGEDVASKAKRNMRLSMGRLQIDGAMENISNVTTGLGARKRTIENQNESTEDFKLTAQKSLSNLEDLHLAAAVSEFKLEESLLQITQQTFVQMQNLSLFKLL